MFEYLGTDYLPALGVVVGIMFGILLGVAAAYWLLRAAVAYAIGRGLGW